MVKLHLMTAGYCTHPEFITLRGGSFSACRFPALCALITHPTKGYLLFDTGYAERFDQHASRFPFSIYKKVTPLHLDKEKTLLCQLHQKGIAPEVISNIIISHFHADHIAGLRDFPNAHIICSSSAFHSVKGRKGFHALRRGFIPGLLPDDIESRLVFTENAARVSLPEGLLPFTEGYDLVGDGSIIAIPLPGHAEGHTGIYIAEQSTFLVADSCWSRTAFQEYRLPHPITYLIHHRRKAYQETLWKLYILSQCNKELRIIPSHCRLSHA